MFISRNSFRCVNFDGNNVALLIVSSEGNVYLNSSAVRHICKDVDELHLLERQVLSFFCDGTDENDAVIGALQVLFRDAI